MAEAIRTEYFAEDKDCRAPASSSSSSSLEETQQHLLFIEKEEALQCIDRLAVVTERDAALIRLRAIYDKYLECPTLLDPSLEQVVQKLAQPVLRILCHAFLDQTAVVDDSDCGGDDDDDDDDDPTEDRAIASAAAAATARKTISVNIPCIQYHLSALYCLSKVRGRKYIQRFLPHGAEDVEPVWITLQAAIQLKQEQAQQVHQQQQQKHMQQQQQDDDDSSIPVLAVVVQPPPPTPPPLWESTYVLWIWMAGLSLVPFDAKVLMAAATENHQHQQALIIPTLVETCQSHLTDAGPVRHAAAACLASWLSRPDFSQDGLDQIGKFVARAQQELQDYTSITTSHSSSDLFGILGVLQTLTTILKVSSIDRERLMAQMRPLWETTLQLADDRNNNDNSSSLLLRKLLVKWWTRMSCAFLPPRIAAWRYQRGQRSLFFDSNANNANTGSKEVSTEHSNVDEKDCYPAAMAGHSSHDDDTDALFAVPDEVEDAMGRMIETLSHASTIVRWSAAKGVGRITERLPALCAEDVLDAVLQLFEDEENDKRWHGACLALAELARRGLLLPRRLGDVVPLIIRAVHYDRRRGQTSIGSHVRDAACYTYWAFARAYTPAILLPYIAELSESIILTSLFDREVNCRRAASAAFQEAVGRQGATNFPHGIAILTTADYFSLGNRTDSYLSIAVKIAGFEEHRRPILRHLYTSKLFHWDQNIRVLVSRSLHQLASLDSAFVCSSVIPSLLAKCLDEKDLYTRHGAVLGVAEIVLALSESKQLSLLTPTSQEVLTDLVPAIEKKRLYRGRGGEIMRSAVCRLIECLCLAKIPLSVKEQVRLLDSIDANIPHPSETIQRDACRALQALMKHYFPVGEKGPSERLQKRVVDKFVELASSSENPAVARGYALALGYLPAKLLAPSRAVLALVLNSLQDTAKHTALVGGESDAATRRNSLLSLIQIAKTVGFVPDAPTSYPVIRIDSSLFLNLFAGFLGALEDYRTDRRGDVGSWCRLTGMEGVTQLVLAASICDEAKSYISDSLVTDVVGALLKQLSEKLDTVRQRAGDCLELLLLAQAPSILVISDRAALVGALGLHESRGVLPRNWSDPSISFPLVVKAASLGEQSYFENVIAGIVASVGGLTEDVSKHSSASLLQWAKEGEPKRREKLGIYLLQLLDANSGNGRLVLPILKTLDTLFSHGCLDEVTQSSPCFAESCQRALQREAVCKDVPRLFAVVNVSVALLTAFPRDAAVARRALAFVCKMLEHPFPRVRSYTAQQFYLFLLEYDCGKREKALELVLNTPWTSETFYDHRHIPVEIAERLDVLHEFNNSMSDLQFV